MSPRNETKKKYISAYSIQHLWDQGICNAHEIHRRTNIPIRTIHYNIAKLKKTGSVAHKNRTGRPKKITAEASKAVGQYLRRNHSLSVRSLATKLTENHVEVSHMTVLRHLKRLGYKNSLPLATPLLTSAHKERRVEWAQKHLNDNWKKTLFSDETAFQLFRNTIRQWYKGSRPFRYIPKDRSKIFAWGGFCYHGKTNLFCFQQIMDGPFYVEILRKHSSEIYQMLGSNWRFQQDNDPKHTSRVAKKFVEENLPQVIDWPSNSPDINPIENLWGIVKNNVEKRMPKNLTELERFMMEEWENIPRKIVISLINSMKDRCELIILNNGERINY